MAPRALEGDDAGCSGHSRLPHWAGGARTPALALGSQAGPDAPRSDDPDEVLDAGLRLEYGDFLLIKALHYGGVGGGLLCQGRDGALIANRYSMSPWLYVRQGWSP
jgi:hypothetical protein